MSTDETAAYTKPGNKPKPKDAPTEAKGPVTMLVVDTTTQPDAHGEGGKIVSGARTHEQIVNGRRTSFTFKHGEPLDLPIEIAMKFLRHEGFQLVDANGQSMAFKRAPKQPHELGAGEKIELAKDETIARYDELSTLSLQLRVVAMPGGEKFAGSTDRDAMTDFIVKAREAAAKANLSKEADVKGDEFTPEAEAA